MRLTASLQIHFIKLLTEQTIDNEQKSLSSSKISDMGFFKFLKLPKHRNFDYNPQYWDREKEEREKKLKRYYKQEDQDPEAVKARIADSFRKRGGVTDYNASRKQARSSNIRLIIIILVLCVASYVFITVYLPTLLKALGI